MARAGRPAAGAYGAAQRHRHRRPEGYVAEPTLNRLSRVLASSQGGQILLTQATVDLIGPAWPSGLTLHDLGLTQLRDVATPLQLWQALAPDLARADDRPPHLAR